MFKLKLIIILFLIINVIPIISSSITFFDNPEDFFIMDNVPSQIIDDQFYGQGIDFINISNVTTFVNDTGVVKDEKDIVLIYILLIGGSLFFIFIFLLIIGSAKNRKK